MMMMINYEIQKRNMNVHQHTVHCKAHIAKLNNNAVRSNDNQMNPFDQ